MSKHANRYTATITAGQDARQLEELFRNEDKEIQQGRARLEISRTKENIMFTVHAADASALRSMLNLVVKNLAIYEGVKQLP